jgi:hypothetical protein
LTSIPATLLPATAAIIKPVLARTLTETVAKPMVTLDIKPSMVIMLTARERVRREGDRAIERVGGGELECGEADYTRRRDDKMWRDGTRRRGDWRGWVTQDKMMRCGETK